MKWPSRIMDNVTAYRLWQAPFVEKKLHPIRKYNELQNVRRVLDVGCGPGTNTSLFSHSEYLGLDWNPSYIKYAKRRYGREFLATDIRDYVATGESRFDFVLVNSLLHHIDDENAFRILSRLNHLLTDDGHIHILDMVMPERSGIARFLAESDRGDFVRPLQVWQNMFYEIFSPLLFERYSLNWFGITLWNMVYFKGKAKT